MKTSPLAYLPLFFLATVLIFGCEPKEQTITKDSGAKLRFSTDTVAFDTLFSSVGSTTKWLWVYNDNKKAVKVSDIGLASTPSQYQLIIDGKEINSTSNLEIFGGDSILILIEVYIDPMDETLPYLVKDSIHFSTNGNNQYVHLESYGQDAHFLAGNTTWCDTTITNSKAFHISDSITISEGCTCTIEEGVRLFFNQDAKMVVHGTLNIIGSPDSMVTLRADNYLGYEVTSTPGYWRGITFHENSKGSIKSARIENARTSVTYKSSIPADSIIDLEITQSQYFNAFDNLISLQNADAVITNSVFSGAINQNIEVIEGGNLTMLYCTSNNNASTDLNSDPSIVMNGDINLLKVRIENSIVWGNEREEIDIQNTESLVVSNNLLKSQQSNFDAENTRNESPNFKNAFLSNYELDSASVAIGKAKLLPDLTIDLKGNLRDNTPDLGAYEFIETK